MPFSVTRTGPALFLALAIGAMAVPAPISAATPPPHSGGHSNGGHSNSGHSNSGHSGSHTPAPPPQNHRPPAPPQNHRPPAPPQHQTRPAPPTWSGHHQVVRNPQVNVRFNGRRIGNPRYSNQSAWNWNQGRRWNQNTSYWGGGFWGPLAIGAALAAAFGIFSYNNQSYYSYQVRQNSPGAQLLNSYRLEQTPCGARNLVVIWGPNNSVICAWPNNLVGPGTYSVDPQTLTLVSQY